MDTNKQIGIALFATGLAMAYNGAIQLGKINNPNLQNTNQSDRQRNIERISSGFSILFGITTFAIGYNLIQKK